MLFDNLLLSHRNTSYESISCWEMIIFACILYQYDPLEAVKSYFYRQLDFLTDSGKLVVVDMLNFILN